MIEFVVSMVDKVTGPAKMAGSSMLSTANKAKTLQTAMAAAERSMVKSQAIGNQKGFWKAASDIQGLKSALGQLPKATDQMDSGLSGLLGKLTGLGEMGPAAFAEIGLAAYAAIGAVVVAGASLALQATATRAALENSLGALAGGTASGKQLVDMLGDMADKLPQTRAQLGEWSKS